MAAATFLLDTAPHNSAEMMKNRRLMQGHQGSLGRTYMLQDGNTKASNRRMKGEGHFCGTWAARMLSFIVIYSPGGTARKICLLPL